MTVEPQPDESFQSPGSAWSLTRMQRGSGEGIKFQSPGSAWSLTVDNGAIAVVIIISIPRLRVEPDCATKEKTSSCNRFQSPGSAWSLTACVCGVAALSVISIPRLRVEPDAVFRLRISGYGYISIPRLRVEPDYKLYIVIFYDRTFQSPGSAWSLTNSWYSRSSSRRYFNPQAPRGA